MRIKHADNIRGQSGTKQSNGSKNLWAHHAMKSLLHKASGCGKRGIHSPLEEHASIKPKAKQSQIHITYIYTSEHIYMNPLKWAYSVLRLTDIFPSLPYVASPSKHHHLDDRAVPCLPVRALAQQQQQRAAITWPHAITTCSNNMQQQRRSTGCQIGKRVYHRLTHEATLLSRLSKKTR